MEDGGRGCFRSKHSKSPLTARGDDRKEISGLGEAGAISRPWSTRSIADRDAADPQSERRLDDFLNDVAIGRVDGGRRNEANATVPVAVAVAVGGRGGGGQSGGTDHSRGAEGESELAEYGGSPVSGTCTKCASCTRSRTTSSLWRAGDTDTLAIAARGCQL